MSDDDRELPTLSTPVGPARKGSGLSPLTATRSMTAGIPTPSALQRASEGDILRVTELIGDEGGRWKVHTEKSFYIMDLDAMTVVRHPGPNASPTINDRARPIRSLVHCRVGEHGYWTMDEDGPLDPNESYWQATTIIQRIERLGEEQDRA